MGGGRRGLEQLINPSESGAEGDRTPDLRAASAALSRLSYGPEKNAQSILPHREVSTRWFPVGVEVRAYSSQCSWGAARQKDSRR